MHWVILGKEKSSSSGILQITVILNLSLSAHKFLKPFDSSWGISIYRGLEMMSTIYSQCFGLWFLVKAIKCVSELDSIIILKLLLFLSYSHCWKTWRPPRCKTFHKHLWYESFMTLPHLSVWDWMVNAKRVSSGSNSQECNMQSTQRKFNTLAAN